MSEAKSLRENGQSMIVECLVNKDSKMTHFIHLTIKSAIAQHQTKVALTITRLSGNFVTVMKIMIDPVQQNKTFNALEDQQMK